MLYHVQRNGQQYGPYTLDDLKSYVSTGNVLLTDLIRSDDTPDWIPVSQVLGIAPPAAVASYTGAAPQSFETGAPYPDPPNLHWALVLLIGVFTCGMFTIVWIMVEAAWVRKIDPRSKALFYYIIAFVLDVASVFLSIFMQRVTASGGANQSALTLLSLLITFAFLALFIIANFSMRDSIEAHFNGAEPIGLSLSGIMTFFFSVYYFQYHFSRINELKRATRYGGASI
ncbi:MAG TPA: DUF4339 domain-containing protein [Acidobacteriaceae bacterium]